MPANRKEACAMTNMPTQLTTDFDAVLDRGDIAEARRLLARSLHAAVPKRCSSLLRCLWGGHAHAEADSFATLKQAAEKGYIPAIHAVGLCLLTGDRVEQDVMRAAAHFERASEAGYPSAMYDLAWRCSMARVSPATCHVRCT
jgi:TPR repeat protein